MILENTNIWLVIATIGTGTSPEVSLTRLVCADDAAEAEQKFRGYCEAIGTILSLEVTSVLF